jgi:hypothetical protein
MFPYYRSDDRTDRERYLENELEDVRRAEEERREREERAREERRREWQEQRSYEERQADSWPEAFQKQAHLCWREHNNFPEQDSSITGDPDDDYFKDAAQANEKALEIWREVVASKKAKLDELQAQIDAVMESVRLEVADKLEAISDKLGYRSTAQAIRDDELDRYLDW